MRSRYLPLLWLACATVVSAQSGPCTESAVLKGALPAADNAFSYMPVYSKPAETKAAADQANEESFSDRINRKFEWADDHHVGASPSGDMAYEHGTMHVSYDTKSDGKHHSFDAVMLVVYQAKGSECQQVAMTMYPLEDAVK
jgi:ketosteroid isomerase-like protein